MLLQAAKCIGAGVGVGDGMLHIHNNHDCVYYNDDDERLLD
jgi:hypothetical protein